jgi:hypothetical protein
MRPLERCGDDAVRHGGGSLEDALDQCFLVDGVVDRLPHPHVLERTFAGVQDQEPQVRPRLFMELEAAGLAQQVHRVGRNLDHQVEAAGQQLGQAGVSIGQRAEDHCLELRGAVPVVWIALDHDLGVALPFGEAVGAGADGLAAKVLAALADGFWRYDQPGRIGEVGQQRGVGFLQVEDDSARVGGFGAFDGAEEEGEREGAGVVLRVLVVQHAVEVELDRLGVERRAVVELDAMPEREGIGPAVR